jgi:hypothetical protein
MRFIRFSLLLLPLAAAAAGCSDANSLPSATSTNVVDTVTLWALQGTPITTPSGFSIFNGAVRTDVTVDFEFAYNIQGADSQHVFLPRAVLGISSGSTAEPGLQRRSESFDSLTVAASNGYVTDSLLTVNVGDVFLVRSRVVCTSLGVPLYGKLQVLSFDDKTVTFQVLSDENCGYKSLEPGVPSR